MVEPSNRIAAALEEQNKLLRKQIEAIEDHTIAVEDLTTTIRNG